MGEPISNASAGDQDEEGSDAVELSENDLGEDGGENEEGDRSPSMA